METAFDGFWEKHQLKMEQYLQLWKFEQSFQEVWSDALLLLAEVVGEEKEGKRERFFFFFFLAFYFECLIYAAAPCVWIAALANLGKPLCFFIQS